MKVFEKKRSFYRKTFKKINKKCPFCNEKIFAEQECKTLSGEH